MDSESSNNSDSYTDPNRSLAKFLKNQDASEPDPRKKFKKIPKMSPEEESSDSYNISSQKNVSFPKGSSKNANKKQHSTHFESSDEDATNSNFTTSQINPDYKLLDEQYANNGFSSSDDESQKIYYRRPPPSSVAYQLRSSSSDDEGKPKPKPRIPNNSRRFAESVAPYKKTKFRFEDESINNDIKFDDSVSQRGRPMARTTAPSVSSFKSTKSSKSRKWTPSVASESPLDREIEQLIETESRLTAAENEKLAKDLEFYNNDITSTSSDNNTRKQSNPEQPQKKIDDDVQTKIEKYYARMLKKKFPHLVDKKEKLHKKQERRHQLNFNNDIISWSREMIENDNERLQQEINQVTKQLKHMEDKNNELKKQIHKLDQDFDEYDYDYDSYH